MAYGKESASSASHGWAFPSSFYGQLNLAHAAQNQAAVKNLLQGLKIILDKEAKIKDCKKVLIDTSPFYAGGTAPLMR